MANREPVEVFEANGANALVGLDQQMFVRDNEQSASVAGLVATDGPVEHHHGIRSVRPHIPFLGGRQIQPFQRGHDGFFLTNQSLSFQSIPHPLIDLVNF